MLEKEVNTHLDAITFKQPLILPIKDSKTLELLKDTNLGNVLKILRSGPKTVEEVCINFPEKKSMKSIYRYIKKLKNVNLVVQAGKRVFNDQTTHTLYMRSAKIFFPIGKENEYMTSCYQNKDLYTILIKYLEKKLELKIISDRHLINFLANIQKEEEIMIQDFFKNAEEENDDELFILISKLEWENIKSLVYYLGMLNLILHQKSWQNEIKNCFSK